MAPLTAAETTPLKRMTIEDWSGNGCLDNWVYDNLDTEGKRLLKLADYLRGREERKYRVA